MKELPRVLYSKNSKGEIEKVINEDSAETGKRSEERQYTEEDLALAEEAKKKLIGAGIDIANKRASEIEQFLRKEK